MANVNVNDQITYDYGSVSGFASDTANKANQLMEIHGDILNRTNALTEFFAGSGATGFFEAQAQMLNGLEGLAQTVSNHSCVVNNVNDNAMATDQKIVNFFG